MMTIIQTRMAFFDDYQQFSKDLFDVTVTHGAPLKHMQYVCHIHMNKTINDLNENLQDVQEMSWFHETAEFYTHLYKNELLIYFVAYLNHTKQWDATWAKKAAKWVHDNHPSLVLPNKN